MNAGQKTMVESPAERPLKAPAVQHTCSLCGSRTERLYQNDACKNCLSQILKASVALINQFRN